MNFEALANEHWLFVATTLFQYADTTAPSLINVADMTNPFNSLRSFSRHSLSLTVLVILLDTHLFGPSLSWTLILLDTHSHRHLTLFHLADFSFPISPIHSFKNLTPPPTNIARARCTNS